MSKPTLLQSLLNRPSQSYSFPQEKVYFSTKRDMVRIAAETHGGDGPHSLFSRTIAETAVVRVDPRQVMSDDVYQGVTSQQNLTITNVHDDNEDSNNDNSDSNSDSELDVFYTPSTSPCNSIIAPAVRSTTTPMMKSNNSTTSFSSTFDAPSLFSLPASDSTRVTTPVHSEAGHIAKQSPDWAKDVRWLVPDRDSVPDAKSTITPSPTPRRRRHSSETHSQHPQLQLQPPPPPKSHSLSQTRSKPNTSISKSISKTNPSIMSSMAALLEEDEPHTCEQNPRSSVIISRSTSLKQSPHSSKNGTPITTPISRSRSPSPHNLSHKRSRSLGHASAPRFKYSSTTPSSSNHSHSSHSHPRSGFASSSSDPFRPSSTSLPTFTPGNLPSHGTRGFTSLVLPRAPVPFSQSRSSNHPRIGVGLMDSIGAGGSADGKVDLTRSGVAQTTMASVEVVYGLSGDMGGGGSGGRILGKGKVLGNGGAKSVMGLFKRGGSVSPSTGPSSAFGMRSPGQFQRKRSQSENGTILGNGHASVHTHRGGPERPLAFTSYRKPPGYVPSGSVLVQVWAVGVDSVDAKLVFGGVSGMKERSQAPLSPSVMSPDGEVELSRSTTPMPLLSGDEKEKSSPPSPVTPSPKRTMSLRSTLGRFSGSSGNPNYSPTSTNNMANGSGSSGSGGGGGQPTPPAGVGYIPGRSFVGRVLECGWEVGEQVGKRGDWVAGLLDVKKCGALTEFVVVDRRRVHRVPYPRMDQDSSNPFLAEGEEDHGSTLGPSRTSSTRSSSTSRRSSLPSPLPSPSPSRHASVNSKYSQSRPSIPSPLNARSPGQLQKPHPLQLTLEEMALLPVCGIPAYRAVRTFAFEFAAAGERDEGGAVDGGFNFGSVDAVAGGRGGGSPVSAGSGREKDGVIGRDHERGGRRRRALVVRGHDGAGAMAVQMLVRRGWRVCVHVPFGCVRDEEEALERRYTTNEDGEEEEEDKKEGRYQYCMRMVEERVRAWGGEEVIFDDGEESDGDDGRSAAVRAIDRLRVEGDMFDAVLDTIGGKEVWEASERLLRSFGRDRDVKTKKDGKKSGMYVKQFTTLVGDSPGRVIPSAKDNLKAGFRSLNISVGRGVGDGKKQEGGGKIGYAWVSIAHDVDWEGEDVSESLDAVLRLAMEDGMRPWVGLSGKEFGSSKGKGKMKSTTVVGRRVVPFEKVPDVFVPGSRALADGGTVVVKVVA